MKVQNKGLIYPIVLIVFILYILYIFFFGDNGLIVHKEKLSRIKVLQKKNKELYDKIYGLNRRLTLLGDNSPFYLEEEARSISLKKEGDIIIRLYNNDLIEELAVSEELFYRSDFGVDSEEFDEGYSSYQGEILLGLLLNISVAFILTIIVPLREKE